MNIKPKYTIKQRVRIKTGLYKGWTGYVDSITQSNMFSTITTTYYSVRPIARWNFIQKYVENDLEAVDITS